MYWSFIWQSYWVIVGPITFFKVFYYKYFQKIFYAPLFGLICKTDRWRTKKINKGPFSICYLGPHCIFFCSFKMFIIFFRCQLKQHFSFQFKGPWLIYNSLTRILYRSMFHIVTIWTILPGWDSNSNLWIQKQVHWQLS